MVKGIIIAGSALSIIGLSFPVSAQQTSPVNQTDVQPDQGLGDIIVTARRTGENMQRVPISITALQPETLARNNITSVQDVARIVPSLSTSGPYTIDAFYVMRGQGGNVAGGVPAVASYMNEVPLPGQVGGPGFFYDLENVQVLKGAQGTLFGRNSTGGAILFQSAMPTSELGGFLQVGVGNYSNREATGALNLPLASDQLMLRIAFNYQKRDGYTRLLAAPGYPNGLDIDDRDLKAVRGTLTMRPSDVVRNDIIVDYYNFKNRGNNVALNAVNPDFFANVVAPVFGPDAAAAFLQQFQTLLAQQKALGARTLLPASLYAPNSKESLLIINRTTVTLTDNLTLKNIFAYAQTRSYKSFDGDGTIVPHLDFNAVSSDLNRQFTNELQLQGNLWDDRVKFTIGGFYLKAPKSPFYKIDRRNFFGFANSQEQTRYYETSKAVFGQATAAVTDDLKVTAGLRYTHDKRSGETRQLTGIGPDAACTAPPFPPSAPEYDASDPCRQSKTSTSSRLTGNLSLDYQILPKTLVYVAARRGYRGGGANAQAILAENSYFSPETITEFEAGLKSDFNIGTVPVRANVAAYYGRVKGLQIATNVVEAPRPTTAINITRNLADTSTVKGAEVELTLRPVPGLTLAGNGSYNHFDVNIPAGSARAGTPKFQIAANGTYTHDLAGDAGAIALTVAYDWRSKFFKGPNVTPDNVQDAVGFLNASLEWSSMFGSSVSATLFGTNLLNKVAAFGNYGVYNDLGYSANVYSEPRIYGVRVRYSF